MFSSSSRLNVFQLEVIRQTKATRNLFLLKKKKDFFFVSFLLVHNLCYIHYVTKSSLGSNGTFLICSYCNLLCHFNCNLQECFLLNCFLVLFYSFQFVECSKFMLFFLLSACHNLFVWVLVYTYLETHDGLTTFTSSPCYLHCPSKLWLSD